MNTLDNMLKAHNSMFGILLLLKNSKVELESSELAGVIDILFSQSEKMEEYIYSLKIDKFDDTDDISKKTENIKKLLKRARVG